MIFQFSYGKCEKKSKLAVLETLYDTVHYLNWKSLWDCVELYRTLLQQSLAVDVLRPVWEKEKNRMDDPIVQYVYIYKWWLYLQVDFKYFIFQ